MYISGAALGGFPETPSEIARAPKIRLGDQNYKELYILYYIMAFSIGKTSYKTNGMSAL